MLIMEAELDIHGRVRQVLQDPISIKIVWHKIRHQDQLITGEMRAMR